MTEMPIYIVKTFKDLLRQSQKSYDLETWHAASETQDLHNFNKLKDDPGLTLTCFTARSNLVFYTFETVTKALNGRKHAANALID